MKLLFILLTLMMTLPAWTFDRGDVEQLLLEKGTSIAAFEAQGLRLVMGERSGGGKNLQFASVEVVIIKDEAILKQEIQNASLQNGNRLGNLKSLQAGGRHIDGGEVIGVIAR